LIALLVLVLLALLTFRTAVYFREDTPFGEASPDKGRYVPTPEGSLFVIEHGDPDAPPVLFAHGTAAWSGLWEPTLGAAARSDYRSIAFDMPPFGFSQHASDEDYSRQRQADRALALIQTMDIRPIIVAHSVGAGPMAEMVLRHPDAVSGLIIVDGAIALGSDLAPKALPMPLRNDTLREFLVAATGTNPLLTRQFLRSFMHIKDAATDEIVTLLQEPMHQKSYTAAVSAWVPQLFETPRDAISTKPEAWAGLKLPTALIWGDADTITPLEQAHELMELIPEATLIVLPDVGHIPQLEAPAQFQEALLRALNGVQQLAKEREDP